MYPESRAGRIAWFSLGLVFGLLWVFTEEAMWRRVGGGALVVLMTLNLWQLTFRWKGPPGLGGKARSRGE